MKLNARQVETAKPKEKDYKLPDGNGLFLLVKTSGAKYWRYRYTFAGREKMLAIGVFPAVSLAAAREKRDEARRNVAAGVDPVKAKNYSNEANAAKAITFREMAMEWHEFKTPRWSPGYASDILEAFNKDIFPAVGGLPVAEIEPIQMLKPLRKIENRGATEKAAKTRRWCGEVFRYAVATGRAKYNPVGELNSAMEGHEGGPHPFLTAEELPEFLAAVDKYPGSPLPRLGVQIMMLAGLRTYELRHSKWEWVDFDNALWEIPAEFMKMDRPHLVPLSSQLVALLKELHKLTGRFANMFPGRNDPSKVMSGNTINKMIHVLGYQGRVVGHGFRHTFSTILNDHGFNSDWVEMQIAHADENKIRGVYNHALYLEGRREMVQWYADYIDQLRLI
ncbi:tyrosine-type recombinase/integrase [Serratia rubidaea]|uniref:Prophage CPS-53 integrase n=1 Tax=Serratia rubidaea TaxID=61652 RepID=A0A3S5F138_SERRU|nr:integrase arm-type DNA-binding domain-containing protein [Serratia rubidaea]VEI61617.1 Putative prophage CPS-53 integrase [Serratia rubidaea]